MIEIRSTRRSCRRASLLLAVALFACACLGAAPARAARFGATIKAVPAGPYAKVSKLRGDAHLTAAPGFSQLTVDLRRVSAGASYEFSLRQATAPGDPCKPTSGAAAATPVPDWSFFPIVANSRGRAHGVGRSNSFVPDPAARYYVDVRQSGGPQVGCGIFKRQGSDRVAKKPKPRSHPRRRGQKRGQHRAKRHRRHR